MRRNAGTAGLRARRDSHGQMHGILHDPCEPKCGADGAQFKGIFARNLGALDSAAPSPRFQSFLRANAERICQVQTADHRFGVLWSGPSEAVNAATPVSALDAILAAIRIARTAGEGKQQERGAV